MSVVRETPKPLTPAEAVTLTDALGLPDLAGSQKQIDWAWTLRADLVNRLLDDPFQIFQPATRAGDITLKRRINRISDAKREAIRPLVAEALKPLIVTECSDIDNAGWWIENRACAAMISLEMSQEAIGIAGHLFD